MVSEKAGGQFEEEEEHEEGGGGGQHLPPPPPLQRAPQYRASPTALQERRGVGEGVQVSSTPVTLEGRRSGEGEEGVSKLVMKTSGGGRGTSRRRALIHSIPKFSQVQYS